MVVLLNFLKYLRSVLFPKIIVSLCVGFVLYLCHDLRCLMTGQGFGIFVIIQVLFFLLLVEKCCLFRILTGVLYQVGHED